MDWIKPMEPKALNSIVTGEEWIYQIKWDGIRGLTYCLKDDSIYPIRIFTKNRRERTQYYPELHSIKDLIVGNSAVLDGELIVLGDDNKPSFQLSLIRERIQNVTALQYYINKYPVIYVVFDILYYNGSVLIEMSLRKRQEILNNCLMSGSNITIAENYKDGFGLLDIMEKKGWEGIVSKKINSKYYPGKNHNEWFKHKISRKILAAVCGVNWKNDSPYSLLLGILKENQWIYIGRVSSGLSQKDWQIIKEYAVKYKKEECPFNKTVAWEKQQVTWLTPSLTCWVAFLEWTNDGVLRNPRIIGFSNKSVEEANGKECPIDE